MKLSARDQRDEVGVDLSGVVGTNKEPVLATHCLAAKLAFTEVVVDGQPPVVEEARERGLLVQRVAQCLLDRSLVEGAEDLEFAPGEEAVDDLLAQRLARRQAGLGR